MNTCNILNGNSRINDQLKVYARFWIISEKFMLNSRVFKMQSINVEIMT